MRKHSLELVCRVLYFVIIINLTCFSYASLISYYCAGGKMNYHCTDFRKRIFLYPTVQYNASLHILNMCFGAATHLGAFFVLVLQYCTQWVHILQNQGRMVDHNNKYRLRTFLAAEETDVSSQEWRDIEKCLLNYAFDQVN